ncbi:dihydroorotate dehydrogenase family protein [Cupriavidus basilensis OR16]|uniref:Dihydroorotate dehydrogenase family protein n=1 Tax=Cupriavidus basilensis OR16 TaxID=1127483 RepID=H1SHM1_9BURK|nr:dihydroorotate dehydrogenase family protein [Cupriavidus basilensis OR16]
MPVLRAAVRLRNPVMPASGCFAIEYREALDLNQLGALVIKSVSPKSRAGNPTPRVAETYGGMLNAIGIPSKGLDYYRECVLPPYTRYDTPVVVSISADTAEAFALACEQISLPQQHRGRGPGGGRRRRRCHRHGQHGARHGHRCAHPPAQAGQCDGRPVRPGHQADCPAPGAPVLSRRAHPHHWLRRHPERRGCRRVHARRRGCRAGWHGVLPRPRRHAEDHRRATGLLPGDRHRGAARPGGPGQARPAFKRPLAALRAAIRLNAIGRRPLAPAHPAGASLQRSTQRSTKVPWKFWNSSLSPSSSSRTCARYRSMALA